MFLFIKQHAVFNLLDSIEFALSERFIDQFVDARVDLLSVLSDAAAFGGLEPSHFKGLHHFHILGLTGKCDPQVVEAVKSIPEKRFVFV